MEITTATFDCYGTLVDWEGGLGTFLYDLALRHGDDGAPDGQTLRRRWEAIQFEVIQGSYKSYKTVLAESLRAWCAERGYPYADADGEALARAMRSWQPFHDTRPSLARAKAAGLRLVIVSNTDRDLIAHSLKHIGVAFDGVITAEDAGAYKPADAIFRQALARVGEAPERMLHVGGTLDYDAEPAARFGWQTAWVNRAGEPVPAGARPNFDWRNLWGFAELAEAAAAGWRGPRAASS